MYLQQWHNDYREYLKSIRLIRKPWGVLIVEQHWRYLELIFVTAFLLHGCPEVNLEYIPLKIF